MQMILLYLLKVILCSGLLLGYYWIALRDKQFHQYNRFYLLFVVLLSIILPLIQLEWFTFRSHNEDTLQLLQAMYAVKGAGKITHDNAFAGWQFPVACLFALAGMLLLLTLALRIGKLYRLRRQYTATRTEEGFLFIETDLPQAPFSFLHWLFWRKDIMLNSTDGNRILQHELAHISQKHTWDKLFMQVVLALYWINPFFWLLQKELSMVHEFIADQKAVQDKDAAAFASMLLHAHARKFVFAPAQSFFHSPIKRRLTMLTTSRQPRYDYVRRLMILPISGIIMLLFAFRIQGIAQAQPKPEAKVVVKHQTKDSLKIQKKSSAWDTVTVRSYGNNKKLIARKDTSHGTIEHLSVTGNARIVELTDDPDSTGASKSAQEPLYILNGKVATKKVLSDLAPDAIRSIDVLKDKAATAAYGTAGANGVIIIATKSGKP